MADPSSRIRLAEPADVPVVLAMVRELAEFEREPDAVEATEELLHAALFGPAATVFVHLAEHLPAQGQPEVAGMALWFTTYSTWVGRHGLWLEDLYVRPQHRGRGHGRALLASLARVCVERGFGRLEWRVLDWNTGAQGVYAAVGAAPVQGWATWRLDGAGLQQLGSDVAAAPAPPGIG